MVHRLVSAEPKVSAEPPYSPQKSQVVGAYTGGGMSLVDAGMVPFQKAYLMICKPADLSEGRALIPYPISRHDFRDPCWKPRIGTSVRPTISQLELITRYAFSPSCALPCYSVADLGLTAPLTLALGS